MGFLSISPIGRSTFRGVAFCIFFILGIAMTSVSSQAQKAELTFGVSGLCGMCESRIESAFDQKGIVVADYNLETKQIHVVYKTKKWNKEGLHKLATGVGHDTDEYKASEESYANLHGCCKYREHKSCIESHPEDQ